MVLTAGGDFPSVRGCVAPRRHHLRGWWSGTRGWESPADTFPPPGRRGASSGQTAVAYSPTTPRCAHRRERPNQSPWLIAAENVLLPQSGQFGASQTLQSGGSHGGGGGRRDVRRRARVQLGVTEHADAGTSRKAPSAAVSNAVKLDPPLRQLIGSPPRPARLFAASLSAPACSPASPGLPGALNCDRGRWYPTR